MRVCEICGAMQSMSDTEKRLTTHLEGKLHTGDGLSRLRFAEKDISGFKAEER